jgi:hypothetical protein
MDALLGTVWWSALCLVVGWLVGSVYGFNELKAWFTKR